jgi:predicted MPP superfamily phosphohydrolase
LTPPLKRLTRRRFLWRSLRYALVGAAGAGLYAWRIEPHWVEVVRRDLPIAGLPPSLHGCTLVQLSDLHIGPQVDDAYLDYWLRWTSDAAADLVVFTGDFMTARGDEEIDHVARVLERIPHGKRGTFAILGNHDYGYSYVNRAVADRLSAVVGGSGVTVLRNAAVNVGGLTIIGIDDMWAPLFREHWRIQPELAASAQQPTLVLCHNPDAADKPIWNGYQGWILSGHTHGGQCKPPFLGPPLLPVENHGYVAGEYTVGPNRRLYINRGLGHLAPVRFNARPEITLFTLQTI